MKKIILIVVALMLIPQLVFAQSAQNIKPVLDEYFYSMTVEWDQKDMAFAEEQKELLLNRVRELREEGLSNEQFTAAILEKSHIDLNQLALEIKLRNIQTEAELNVFLMEKIETTYSKGANWAGEVAIGALAVGGVGLLAFLFVRMIYGIGQCMEIFPCNKPYGCQC
jgi:hypothetical protein